jgi:hypothetical protein
LRSYGIHPVFVYEDCGKAINGYNEDFYTNGNIRIRGNFRDGRPKDSVVTFFTNGITEKRMTFLPKEIFIQIFDSSGNLTEASHNSNRSYYLTEYDNTKYFSNGKIRRHEIRNKTWISDKEFYSGGQLKTILTKNYCKKYFENGDIEIIYNWKRKKVKEFREKRFQFRVIKTTYDLDGNKTEEVSYDYWQREFLQPTLEIAGAEWIHDWVKYSKKEITIIAHEISTDEYFHKN